MSLKNIRASISTALQGVSGLNYAVAVPSVINPPMAFPGLQPNGPVSYDFTAGNAKLVYHCYIELLVARAKSLEDAQDELDTYLLPAGSTSIKAAIEAIAWGTDADTCRVSGVSNYGPVTYGGQEYLGARLNLDIWVSS